MGRPLYSHTFITSPAVRDPEPPSCERWSYLNAFDPDSDEFFDNENTVYEDFIDPVPAVNPEDEELDEEDEEEEDEDEEERDMLVVRMGNASPAISFLSDDSSLSTSPGSPARLAADAFLRARQMIEGETENAVRVRLATRPSAEEPRWEPQMVEPRQVVPVRRHLASRGAFRGGPYRSYSQRDESFALPTPSSPIPVPTASRRSVPVDERAFPSPSTPPRQTPATHVSMSPPPTSTPRLYTWSRNPTHSPSPSSGSPFTNPHARTSYAHLSPALIRIRDVTV